METSILVFLILGGIALIVAFAYLVLYKKKLKKSEKHEDLYSSILFSLFFLVVLFFGTAGGIKGTEVAKAAEQKTAQGYIVDVEHNARSGGITWDTLVVTMNEHYCYANKYGILNGEVYLISKDSDVPVLTGMSENEVFEYLGIKKE